MNNKQIVSIVLGFGILAGIAFGVAMPAPAERTSTDTILSTTLQIVSLPGSTVTETSPTTDYVTTAITQRPVTMIIDQTSTEFSTRIANQTVISYSIITSTEPLYSFSTSTQTLVQTLVQTQTDVSTTTATQNFTDTKTVTTTEMVNATTNDTSTVSGISYLTAMVDEWDGQNASSIHPFTRGGTFYFQFIHTLYNGTNVFQGFYEYPNATGAYTFQDAVGAHADIVFVANPPQGQNATDLSCIGGGEAWFPQTSGTVDNYTIFLTGC